MAVKFVEECYEQKKGKQSGERREGGGSYRGENGLGEQVVRMGIQEKMASEPAQGEATEGRMA